MYRLTYMRIVRVSDETDQLIEDLIAAKEALAVVQERVEAAENKILEFMEAKQQKTVALNDGRRVYTATYTQRTTNVINEIGLRKALRAPVYDKYTKKVLDRKALERAMTDGHVDPMVVAKFVEQVPGSKYLTFRVKDEDEAEGV